MDKPLRLCVIGLPDSFLEQWLKERLATRNYKLCSKPEEAIQSVWEIAIADITVFPPHSLQGLFRRGQVIAVGDRPHEHLAIQAMQLGACDYILFEEPQRLPLILQRERRLRAAMQANLDSLPMPVYYQDAQGLLLKCNTAFENLFNEPLEKAIGKPLPSPLGAILDAPVSYRYEDTLSNPSGPPRDVTVYKSALCDFEGGVRGSLGVILDITERKQAEDRFYRAFHSSPDLMAISTLEQGTIININDTFLCLSGYSAEEAIGHTSAELGLFEDLERSRIIAQLKKDGRFTNREVRLRTKAGEWKTCLYSAECIMLDGAPHMLSVAKDITALKRAQQEIEDLYHKAPCGYHSVDAKGFFIRINDRELEWLGYTQEEVVGKLRYTDVLTKESALLYQETFPRFLKEGEVKGIVHEMKRRDGSTFWVLLNATAIYNEDGQFEASRSTLVDITERLRHEEERIELQQQQIKTLKEGDRIKDEFLSVISHELRTPLNAIMGFGSLLDDGAGGKLRPEAHEFVDRILESANRMLALINDLLDVARLQAGKYPIILGEIAYEPLITDTVASIRPLAQKKGISVEWSLDVPIPVCVDGQRISQVISNLLTNAIKYTPEGGHILVKAWLANQTLLTEVTDDGIGIAADNLDKLFSPFRQLDMSYTRQVGGTGLGLSISKGIIEAHGGTIDVRSPGLGQGTTFRFALPLS